MGFFDKCRDCVPPERYPGCQDHCAYGIEAKAKYEAAKEKDDLRRSVRNAIYSQRSENVQRAMRKHR